MAAIYFPKKISLYSFLIFAIGLFMFLSLKDLYIISDDRDYQKRVCSQKNVQTRGAFCIDKNNLFDGGSDYIDGKVCRGIEELVGYSTIVDFGAGLGQYGRCLLRKLPKDADVTDESFKKFYSNILKQLKDNDLVLKKQVIKSWEGFDGGINAEELSENLVKHLDLSIPFDLGKKFDWVMSLEVGEHIPKAYEDVYIDNVAKHAEKGVIISWAIPDQGGSNHINERPNEYIINKFLSKGFSHDQNSQIFLRNKTFFWYFTNTIMVFRPNKKN